MSVLLGLAMMACSSGPNATAAQTSFLNKSIPSCCQVCQDPASIECRRQDALARSGRHTEDKVTPTDNTNKATN
jgi:hypothetical protein